jgi:hypothetical protein
MGALASLRGGKDALTYVRTGKYTVVYLMRGRDAQTSL